ncbi:alginate export family protein [Novosphingobium sp.]
MAEEPPRTNLRYDEDWSDQESGVKNLPLDADGQVRLTLGLEARARQESYANPLWGDAPDDGYLWLRFMPLADLHAGPARIFVQPIVGHAHGVAGGNGPADQTGIDLLQGFADLNLKLGDVARLTLRGGRELVALGSERLVGTRYGPNIPQAFDGGRAILDAGPVQLDLMALRAVEVAQGNFDDHGSGRRRLRAVYASVSPVRDVGFDLYWLGYRNRQARFGASVGPERRETFGLRLYGKRGRLSWNWETMVQRGNFAGQSIRAWSQATETAIAFPRARFSPRLRLRANYASGDRRANDGRLGTFNALFPKGRYFGELTPVGPRNIINLHPSIDLRLASGVTAEVSVAAFWRASLADGIYDVPGSEIVGPGQSRARHIGNQIETSLSWDATSTLSLSGSLGVFGAGGFLRDKGRRDPIYMAGLEAGWKF